MLSQERVLHFSQDLFYRDSVHHLYPSTFSQITVTANIEMDSIKTKRANGEYVLSGLAPWKKKSVSKYLLCQWCWGNTLTAAGPQVIFQEHNFATKIRQQSVYVACASSKLLGQIRGHMLTGAGSYRFYSEVNSDNRLGPVAFQVQAGLQKWTLTKAAI